MTLLQIPTHIHPIWSNVFFYLLIVAVLGFVVYSLYMISLMRKKTSEGRLAEHQHSARIDVIRKENEEKLEALRIEMLKREEDRSRQWMESEKETLHVLNGVSNLLELSDKVDKVEFKKINKALMAIEEKIISEKKLISELRVSEKKYRQLFENNIVGISVHEVILDEKGKPCDYRFLETNSAFEETTGLKKDIIGKTCLEVIPDVEPYWIEIFGNVAVTGNPITFENYNRSTGKNYRVAAYSPAPNMFVAVSVEIK